LRFWFEVNPAENRFDITSVLEEGMISSLRHIRGNPVYGQIYALGLVMPAEEIARVGARLGEDAKITEEGPAHLAFIDPYQINWQISVPGNEFRTSGDFADRWHKL